MTLKKIGFGFLMLGMLSCQTTKNKSTTTTTYSDVKIVGAMKNVMWKGQLGSSIDLDTIVNKEGLYGLGPTSNLNGELLIKDGKSYVSRVTSDSTMTVEQRFDVSAPFFVYANVSEWKELELPASIQSIQDLEKFIDKQTKDSKRPFAFKMTGEVSKARIHVQNLPEGSKVSSPEEAHQGQVNYELINEQSEIVGFFSSEHQGVFTHHDSFLHMHLITKDGSKMGHLDEVELGRMKLYLPKW